MSPLSPDTSTPQIRSIYDGLQDLVSDAGGVDCTNSPSLTKQSFKDDTDINNITAKYERTGALPDMIKENPRYGDFSEAPDYQAALDTVMHAQAQFDALDARIRARFGNDPAQFLEFATNRENIDEMVKLGLAVRLPEPPPAEPPQAAPGSPGTQSQAPGQGA